MHSIVIHYLGIQITVLGYADAVNDHVRIPLIYIYIYIYRERERERERELNSLKRRYFEFGKLRPLNYVIFFSLSSQSHISLYLHFFFSFLWVIQISITL
jgi:hypothetical protein